MFPIESGEIEKKDRIIPSLPGKKQEDRKRFVRMSHLSPPVSCTSQLLHSQFCIFDFTVGGQSVWCVSFTDVDASLKLF